MLEEILANIERRLGSKLTEKQKEIAERLIKQGDDSLTIAIRFKNESQPYYI